MTDSTDDEVLIRRIARDRDHQAFAKLFKRYQGIALNLARNITNTQDQAEEALQEAMIRIWRSARSFQEGGNARGWILRIVAREGLTLVRRRRGHSRKEKALKESGRHREHSDRGPDEQADRGEQVGALRGLVHALPFQDRQLVSLYYGAGLTQDEIASELNMPRRTVSHRIGKVLEALKSRLLQAGFAGALLTEEIGEAICSGDEPSPELFSIVQEKIEKGASLRGRGAVTRGSASLYVVGAVGIVSVLAASWALYSPPAPTPRIQSVPPDDTDQSKKPSKPFHHKWSFKDEPAPEDWALTKGWRWVEGTAKKPGHMLSPLDSYEAVLLPVTLPDHPIVLQTRSRPGKKGRWNLDVCLATSENYVGARQGGRSIDKTYTSRRIPLRTCRTYVIDTYLLTITEGQLWSAKVFKEKAAGKRLLLIPRNCELHDIEIRTPEPDEVPIQYAHAGILDEFERQSEEMKTMPFERFLKGLKQLQERQKNAKH